MIWALLAVLGVPIWLVVGVLTGALVSRRRFRRQDGVFPLLVRQHSDDGWPRRLAYGRCVHDVLLVNSGLALVRTTVNALDHVDPLPVEAPARKLADPRAWTITLDDATRSDIAVAATDAHHVSDALSPRRGTDHREGGPAAEPHGS